MLNPTVIKLYNIFNYNYQQSNNVIIATKVNSQKAVANLNKPIP